MSLLKQEVSEGLTKIESAIICFIKNHPEGVSNGQMARVRIGNPDIGVAAPKMLSWSVLGTANQFDW